MAEIKDYSATAGSNNSASPNGMPENMAPSGVNDAWREGTARLRRWYADISATITTAGAGNAYTFSASRTVSAYAAGDVYLVVADKTNTGAATFNVDAVGAKDLVSVQLAALVAGQIVANGVYWIAYDAINDKFILLNHHTSVTAYAEINTLATLSSLATDDIHDIWDTSATARKGITVANLLAQYNPATACAFHATPASDQSGIVNATPTTITFGTETYDTGADFAASTFTARTTGIHTLHATVQTLTAIADGAAVEVWFETGAGAVLASVRESNGGAAVVGLNLSWSGTLTAADTVVVRINHSHGSNITLDAASTRGQMFFSGHRVT